MRTVLVIDDESGLRSVVQATLGMEGFDVIEASDGQAGLELARSRQPALILCDVHMERMDGYVFVEHLRKDPVTAAIPVILMTGIMKDYSSVRRAMGLGADDYLLKPFSVEDLLTAVRTRLQKQRTIVERAEARLTDLRSSIALSLPHELRTPLVAILGFADLLKTDYETLERADIGAMAADIHSAAMRLHVLIEDFLFFAQIEMMSSDEARMKALRQAKTSNLQSHVEVVARRKAAEHKRPDDLTLQLAECSASISSEYLERILEGLCDNAFKFSGPGKQVGVRCSTGDGW
ncbi:MAG TPA: hybrid sensor histidine kinase/response regulator, partial [Bacteroidota bacterium]